MNLSKSDIEQFVHGIPEKLLLLSVLLPVAGFVSGLVIEFSTTPENTRLFLSTLAGAQAGVLAIVFSVTVIGIQLIATRYSPRMISLFTDSPIFIYTFALFIFSIAVDLALLFSVPASPLRIHTAGVVAASGLGVTAAAALFVFVRTAIQQSTPDGAIDAFISGMTTEKYLSQVKQAIENDSETAHPMHPLYNLTMNALSGNERVTAEKALQEYGDLVQEVLTDFEDQDVFSTEDRKVITSSFKPVFKEHLHDIALHAEEKEENQIVGNATEWQYKLGKEGLDFSDDIVARQAQFGLSDVLRDAPVETGTLTSSNKAWEQLGQFLVDASEKPKPGIVWNISSSIETGVSRQLWKVSDVRWYEYSMTDLYRRMKSSQEALLDHYGDDVARVDMEWQYEHVPDDAPNREEVSAVFKWRKALLETTEHFLRYFKKEGRLPITEGNFKDSWKDICIEASESPAEDYAVTLCQALIEIAVIDRYLLDENGIPWSSSIGRVKYKGNPEVVDKAFDRILEYDYVEEKPGPLFVGEMEEHRKTYYQNQLNLQDLPPLNTIADFEQIIEDIQQDADERWETLKE
jgi:hypothetical protein